MTCSPLKRSCSSIRMEETALRLASGVSRSALSVQAQRDVIADARPGDEIHPGSRALASSRSAALLHPAPAAAGGHRLPRFHPKAELHPVRNQGHRASPGDPDLRAERLWFNPDAAPWGLLCSEKPPCAACKGPVGCGFRKPPF